MKLKPALPLIQIWNMSIGFLGIQFGFALQTGNASRILQTFGADIEHLSLFWLAAPITGMLIQPIIGHYSDRTWTRLGRRRPYFLGGAILAATALILMPNASFLSALMAPVWIGAGMLMIMDASFNIAMEPFRALVADKLPESQISQGFSIQTFLISIGAVLGSLMPYVLANLGVNKTALAGQVPDNVVYSFYAGAFLMLFTLLWTVFTTKEYSPKEFAEFELNDSDSTELVGAKKDNGIRAIMRDFASMPKTMLQLGVVQFFSWFALFMMWVYMTPAVAQHVYNLPSDDTSSAIYADAGNWVGMLFGIYNGIAAVYALCLPWIARKTNKKIAHAISLIAGGAGMISIYFVTEPATLLLSMIGIGLVWGSILAMPYAILSSYIPVRKMGVYMGIFNFFITLPQLVCGFLGGLLIKYLFQGETVWALVMAGVFMIIGAFTVINIRERKEVK